MRPLAILLPAALALTPHPGPVLTWGTGGTSTPTTAPPFADTRASLGNSPAYAPGGGAWTVDDSTLARLRGVPPGIRVRDISGSFGPRMFVVAVARGRTKIRVSLPPSPVDTMPFREPPPRRLEREVIVTNPAARVEISARADTVAAGQPLELRVRVLDPDGSAIEGAPVQVQYEDGASRYLTTAVGTLRLELKVPGSRAIVASFGKLADTLRVTVK